MNEHAQRPPAEIRYAGEPARLREHDTGRRPEDLDAYDSYLRKRRKEECTKRRNPLPRIADTGQSWQPHHHPPVHPPLAHRNASPADPSAMSTGPLCGI